MNENKPFDVNEVLAEAARIDNLIACSNYDQKHALLIRKAHVLSRIDAEIIRLREIKARAAETPEHPTQLSLELQFAL